MSQFAAAGASLAGGIAAVQGEAVTYRERDLAGDDEVLGIHAISEAVVIPHESEATTDDRGRVWLRAMTVQIKESDITWTVAIDDVITARGQEWAVLTEQSMSGMRQLIVGRDEQMSTHGSEYRRTARRPQGGPA